MKLIDKDALVAEIERRLNHQVYLSIEREIREQLLSGLLLFINTLEVKEVDLKKSFDEYTKDIMACDVQFEPFTHLYNCAKHFFELGLSVNNPITASDRGIAEEIVINLKRVEKDYHINLTKEIEWVRNKVKKGE